MELDKPTLNYVQSVIDSIDPPRTRKCPDCLDGQRGSAWGGSGRWLCPTCNGRTFVDEEPQVETQPCPECDSHTTWCTRCGGEGRIPLDPPRDYAHEAREIAAHREPRRHFDVEAFGKVYHYGGSVPLFTPEPDHLRELTREIELLARAMERLDATPTAAHLRVLVEAHGLLSGVRDELLR